MRTDHAAELDAFLQRSVWAAWLKFWPIGNAGFFRYTKLEKARALRKLNTWMLSAGLFYFHHAGGAGGGGDSFRPHDFNLHLHIYEHKYVLLLRTELASQSVKGRKSCIRLTFFNLYSRHQSKMSSSKKLTCKETLWQVFIRVYKLEIQAVMLLFWTQLCELLPLSPSLWFNSPPSSLPYE